VTVTITDDDPFDPLSDSETFEIEVFPFEEVLEESALAEQVDYTAFERKDMPSPKAKITKINNYGLIKIEFSQKMMVPANITAIGKESLFFKVYSES